MQSIRRARCKDASSDKSRDGLFQQSAWARRGIIWLLICAAGLTPETATAQSDSGWLLRPSLLTALGYDDNVFLSQTGLRDDSVLRLTPALEAGYRSAPTAFNAYYAVDAHRYDEFSQLDDNRAREHGELNFSHEATPRLTLMADTSYIETQIPGELDPQTGLELGRARAERFYVSPAAIYQIDRKNTGSTSYSFSRDEVAGGIGSDAHLFSLGLDRLISRRDKLHFGYRAERFEFENGQNVDMHVLLGGMTRQFTPQTSLTIMAGPRLTAGEDGEDDEIDPEIAASLIHEFNRGDLGLTYTRSQTTVIGLNGAATTQGVTAALVYPFGNSWGLRADTSFFVSELGGLEADGIVTDVELGYRLSDYLTLLGAYEFTSQRGSLLAPDFGVIDRNFIWLGLVIAPPARTDSAWWRRERATSTVFEEPTLRRRESRPGE